MHMLRDVYKYAPLSRKYISVIVFFEVLLLVCYLFKENEEETFLQGPIIMLFVVFWREKWR